MSARASPCERMKRTATDESVDQGLFAFIEVMFEELLPVVAEQHELVLKEIDKGALVAS